MPDDGHHFSRFTMHAFSKYIYGWTQKFHDCDISYTDSLDAPFQVVIFTSNFTVLFKSGKENEIVSHELIVVNLDRLDKSDCCNKNFQRLC